MTKIEEFENRVIQTGITVEDLKEYEKLLRWVRRGLWSLGKICWQFLRFHRFAVVLEKDIVRIRPIYGAERVYPQTVVRWRIVVRLRKGVEEIRLYSAEGDERLASVRTNWPNAGALLMLEHYGGAELTPEQQYIVGKLKREPKERH